MHIENGSKFLVLHAIGDGGHRRVELLNDFAECLGSWTPSTRLSPVWPIAGYQLGLPDNFAARQALLFLGPIQPARISDELIALRSPGALELWLSAGCFNVIARGRHADGDALNPHIVELEAWARAQCVPHELWIIDKGEVVDTRWWTADPAVAQPHLEALSAMAKQPIDAALRPALQEFLAVQASSLTRSAAMAPDLFSDFALLGGSVAGLIEAHRKGGLDALDLNSRLLSLNAALSRASSQTFSGTPPIDGTECHFWIHSLLGTGSANIALARLAAWVGGILGEERMPERLYALEAVTLKAPDLSEMQMDAALLNQDILHLGHIKPDERGPIIPLITYFSGRDGFSSHLQTLSAPVSTLSECNSYRSSLMTVTHEISHILINGVLGPLYPDHTCGATLTNLGATLAMGYRPPNWLASARKLLFEGLVSMEGASRPDPMGIEDIQAEAADILVNWRAEAQETLVHAFDFMYFYAGDPEFYIESIWRSWSAIPGISDRISGYVMRTLSAVSANLLKEPSEKRLPAAIRAVKESLEDLKASGGLMSDYVDRALAYLAEAEAEPSKMRKLKQEYTARLYLVRLVRLFLYSDRIAAKLFDDPYTRSKGRTTGGKSSLHYDAAPVGNPLAFLRDTIKQDPVEAESVWVLHTLAFDLRQDLPGGAHAGG